MLVDQLISRSSTKARLWWHTAPHRLELKSRTNTRQTNYMGSLISSNFIEIYQ